jgi:hypothetical protein
MICSFVFAINKYINFGRPLFFYDDYTVIGLVFQQIKWFVIESDYTKIWNQTNSFFPWYHVTEHVNTFTIQIYGSVELGTIVNPWNWLMLPLQTRTTIATRVLLPRCAAQFRQISSIKLKSNWLLIEDKIKFEVENYIKLLLDIISHFVIINRHDKFMHLCV